MAAQKTSKSHNSIEPSLSAEEYQAFNDIYEAVIQFNTPIVQYLNSEHYGGDTVHQSLLSQFMEKFEELQTNLFTGSHLLNTNNSNTQNREDKRSRVIKYAQSIADISFPLDDNQTYINAHHAFESGHPIENSTPSEVLKGRMILAFRDIKEKISTFLTLVNTSHVSMPVGETTSNEIQLPTLPENETAVPLQPALTVTDAHINNGGISSTRPNTSNQEPQHSTSPRPLLLETVRRQLKGCTWQNSVKNQELNEELTK